MHSEIVGAVGRNRQIEAFGQMCDLYKGRDASAIGRCLQITTLVKPSKKVEHELRRATFRCRFASVASAVRWRVL